MPLVIVRIKNKGDRMGRIVDPNLYTREYFLDACGGYPEYHANKICPRLMQTYYFCVSKLGTCNSVMDIGFGRGELAAGLADGGFKVVGVDYSQNAYDIAIEKYAQKSNLTFMCGDICNVKIDDTFDIFTIADTVEHMYDEQLSVMFGRIVNEWRRGEIYMCISTPFGSTVEKAVPAVFLPGHKPTRDEQYIVDMHVNVKNSVNELIALIPAPVSVIANDGSFVVLRA
jgi:SAM-dependent methyltransferase